MHNLSQKPAKEQPFPHADAGQRLKCHPRDSPSSLSSSQITGNTQRLSMSLYTPGHVLISGTMPQQGFKLELGIQFSTQFLGRIMGIGWAFHHISLLGGEILSWFLDGGDGTLSFLLSSSCSYCAASLGSIFFPPQCSLCHFR